MGDKNPNKAKKKKKVTEKTVVMPTAAIDAAPLKKQGLAKPFKK